MTITVVCRDLETDQTHVFKAPTDCVGDLGPWLYNHLVKQGKDEGLSLEIAQSRALDYEIRTAFVGDCQELKL